MSRIITFYSYKGGVGRTFALANIAVLLAKRGKRVLLMDWDLEAPGLHRYFKPYFEQTAPGAEGLIHLLGKAESDSAVSWKSFITKVRITNYEPIHLIASGDQAPDYIDRVRSFSWNTFFEQHAGGDLLNRWRDEWKRNYDFVLVDSRTGITDTGGVCTIYLPDILVLVFSANEQSFERGIQIASGVQKARRDLAVPRPPLAVLPLPGRFDGRDEVDEAQFWLNRFAEELKPFYDDWLPKGLNPRQILELTKIPYITKFSFGEPLPVVTQGTTDPEFPGFYLENVARLLLSDFQEAQQIVSPDTLERSGGVAELRSILASVPADEAAIARAIASIELQIGSTAKLAEFLTEAGIALLRQQRLGPAESYFRRALAMNSEAFGSSHPLVLSSINNLADLLSTSGRLGEAEMLYRHIVEVDIESDASTKLGTYTNLANICRQMGRLDEALSWYQRVLNSSEMVKRPDGPIILATYNSLAGICQEMGRIVESVEWYQRALSVAEQTGRIDDPAVLAAHNNLAVLYQKTGRSDEAIELYQRALHMAERADRPGDPAVLATYNNLAALYQKTGRSDEAIEWYQRALHMAERADRPGDPAVLATYNNLATLYQKTGRNDDAVEWYQRALRMVEHTARPGDTAILGIHNSLGTLYRKMGRNEEAIRVYTRALQTTEMAGRPLDSTGMATCNNLASIYKEIGSLSEAIRWSERALDAAQRIFGSESTQAASQLNYLADFLIEAGDNRKAETLLRHALDIHLARRGKKTPVAGRTRRSLARILEATGRSEEAAEISQTATFDVFISYGLADSDVVRNLARKLAESGLNVWFDQWQLRPGEPVQRAVAKAVSSAASFVFCVGRSGPSDGMQAELFSSLAVGGPKNQLIIPIVLPNGEPHQIPVPLREYQFLDLRGGVSDESLLPLLNSIKRKRTKT